MRTLMCEGITNICPKSSKVVEPCIIKEIALPPTVSREKKARRIAYLLAGYMRDNLISKEHDELDEWVGASDKNMMLFEELTDERRVQMALDLMDGKSTPLIKRLREEDFIYKPSFVECIKRFFHYK